MANSESGPGAQEELLRKPTPLSPASDKQFGLIRRSLSVSLRLAIWYIIFTAFFRCPTTFTELTPHSPGVCKPYLIVRSHVEPHVAPYYRRYGEPYVDIVRPYARSFRDQVYYPVTNVSTKAYHTYGAPRLAQGSIYAEKQWNDFVSPQLQSAKSSLDGLYDAYLGHHIQQVKSITAPQYDLVSTQLASLRDGYLIPAYTRSKPTIDKVYNSAQQFIVEIVIPYTCKGWSNLVLLFNGTLRPHVASLYFENVEPQLVRIGAKLASYREGRKLKRLQEEVESLGESLRPTTTLPSPSLSATAPTTSQTTSSVAQVDVSTTSSASRARQTAQERIAADLREWQEKFAIAADNGSEELEKEVADIVANLRKSGAVEAGEKLVSELETVSQRELGKLRSTISQIVGSLPDDASIEDEKRAQDALLQALKASGIMIRERAHSLRKWFNEYDNELVRDVTTVVEATLEVLDHIRDLGLQEIGMRWAWMDGVTYKDWAKFHALKKQFSDWHDEVNDVGMGHEEFLRARAVGDDILSQGMNAAERTAKQLSALKEVGIWKIKAGDTSSDFDASVIDPAKIRTRTKAAIVTSPSATSTAPVSNGSTHTETSTLAIRSHVEGSQLPSQESSEILRGENPDTTPTPNGAPVPESLGSPILSGASSLGSDAIDKAQTAGKSAKSQMSSRLSSTLEAAHSKATEGVSAGSEPVSSGASSLSEHVKGSTEQTNSVAQPLSTGEVKSSPGNISARSEMLNPDRDANNIKKDKHNHADPIALADDEEISLSIVASSQFSHATSHPSDPTDIQAWDSAGDAEPVNMQEDQDIRYQLKDSTRVRATPSAVPGANLKSILSSANHELRSLVDSVSIGVRASSIDYNEANSILNEADTRLESAASAAQAALSHAVYGSSLPTNTPSESNNENSDQKLLRSAVGQLDAFSTIVDVYLQQVRSELEEEDIVSPASLPAHPTTTSNAVQDEL